MNPFTIYLKILFLIALTSAYVLLFIDWKCSIAATFLAIICGLNDISVNYNVKEGKK